MYISLNANNTNLQKSYILYISTYKKSRYIYIKDILQARKS